MTEYKSVSTVALPWLTEVRLYDDAVRHAKESHAQDFAKSREMPLPCIVDAVMTAVANPTYIEKSYGNSVVFVDEDSTNASGDPLRVPVKVVNGTSGRVKSFYFATPSGPRELIWGKKP